MSSPSTSLLVSWPPTSKDVDGDDKVFTVSEQTNDYGTLKIDAAGKWSFTLNNSADAVQSLKAGESKELSFTVASQDGTEQVIKITINGANDAATISGPAAGTVTEDGNTDGNDNTAQTVGGQLTSKDVDGDDNVFTVSEQTNDYGTLKIDAAGKWSFTLNNSADAVQSLKAGESKDLSFTVTSQDGTEQVIKITVNGANDGPVLDLDANNDSGDTNTGYVTEFKENAGAVSIVDSDVAISDIDSQTFTGATITLANAKAGDVLVTGDMPGSIIAQINGNVVTLSGNGTAAEYQAALQAVTFNNSSADPDVTPRQITVVVTDGTNNSNTATTTINVVAAPNQAPDAVDDYQKNTESKVIFSESFEEADVSNGSYVIVNNYGDWEITKSGLEIQAGNVGGSTASDGNNHIELDGNNLVKIAQDIETPGATFTLSFDYKPRPGARDDSDMEVSFGGLTFKVLSDANGNISFVGQGDVQINATTADNGWTTISVELPIAADSTTLSFEGLGASNSLGAYVDNIKVVQEATVDVPFETAEDAPITFTTAQLLSNDKDPGWRRTDDYRIHQCCRWQGYPGQR